MAVMTADQTPTSSGQLTALLEPGRRLWTGMSGPGQDVLLAVSLAALAVTSAALTDAPWPAYLVAVASATAVLLHRRAPLLALAVVAACLPLAAWTGHRDVAAAAFAVVLLLSLAGHARLSALVVFVLAAGAMASQTFIESARTGTSLDIDGLLVGTFFTGFAVALAVMVRRYRSNAEELAARNAELERLRAAESRRAVVEERARIARELHDVVAHHVSAIVVRSQAAAHLHERHPDESVAALRYAAAIGSQTLDALRGVLGLLREDDESVDLLPQPGLGELPALLAECRAVGQRVVLHERGDPAAPTAAVQAVLYRVVQEAITNARRHAPGARVDVRIIWDTDEVVVTVDNAMTSPVPAPRAAPGHGLRGMAERAQAVGGRVAAGATGGRWHVATHLPLDRQPVP